VSFNYHKITGNNVKPIDMASNVCKLQSVAEKWILRQKLKMIVYKRQSQDLTSKAKVLLH